MLNPILLNYKDFKLNQGISSVLNVIFVSHLETLKKDQIVSFVLPVTEPLMTFTPELLFALVFILLSKKLLMISLVLSLILRFDFGSPASFGMKMSLAK